MDETFEASTTKRNKSKSKMDVIKERDAYDSGSNTSSVKSRGPFVHIKGPRESPLSVHIVNSSFNEDEIEKKSNKPKKYHDDGEYRHNVRSRGLHCSTLSTKYDSQTRDATWICVFCKLGPHASIIRSDGVSSGDLFGPYLITCNSQEYVRHLNDPYDTQFKSKKVAHAIIDNIHNKMSIKRSKRKHSDSLDSHSSIEKNENDIYLGISETGNKTYEVWAHEDCIVWSPGVYLVGPKIIGLEEAVWSSCNILCNKCNFKGANLCCERRGCLSVMHYICAITSKWYLDIDNYKVLCLKHKSS